MSLPPPQTKKTVLKKAKGKEESGNKVKTAPSACATKVNQTLSNRNAFDLSFRPNSTVSSIANTRGDENKEFDDLSKKLEFNDYLESLFLDAVVDEKISREKTEIDVKLAEVARRLEMDKVVLRATNERLKEISFLSEQQRLHDQLSQDTEEFLKEAEDSETIKVVDGLMANEDLYCDRLHLKNVDLGYTKDSAYDELNSAIKDTISELNRVMVECSLDADEHKRLCKISADFDECNSAAIQIDKNLKECDRIIPECSMVVLEKVSRELPRCTQ